MEGVGNGASPLAASRYGQLQQQPSERVVPLASDSPNQPVSSPLVRAELPPPNLHTPAHREAKAASATAAEAIFAAKNRGRAPTEVDLHGLQVAEVGGLGDVLAF